MLNIKHQELFFLEINQNIFRLKKQIQTAKTWHIFCYIYRHMFTCKKSSTILLTMFIKQNLPCQCILHTNETPLFRQLVEQIIFDIVYLKKKWNIHLVSKLICLQCLLEILSFPSYWRKNVLSKHQKRLTCIYESAVLFLQCVQLITRV